MNQETLQILISNYPILQPLVLLTGDIFRADLPAALAALVNNDGSFAQVSSYIQQAIARALGQ